MIEDTNSGANTHDVAVIGAGIQGVGVAQAAAASGYSVVVLEQYDSVAQGTSSRSSKLIHGGLRYLQQGHVRLVHEALRERRYLLRNAPHLVTLKRFFIPVYRYSRRPAWMTRAGLSLYALLGGLRRETRFKEIKKEDWDSIKGITNEQLVAVFQYYDGQTDDKGLTKAVLQSALDLGAKAIFKARVLDIRLEDRACLIRFDGDNGSQILKARTVVNATGPWVNRILDCVRPHQEPMNVELVQGAHIVLPVHVGDYVVYTESPRDRRPVLVMPWGEHTMVGSTETVFEGDPQDTRPLDEEIEYLLEVFCHYFPKVAADMGDIVSSFSGLRVLPQTRQDANRRTRETLVRLDRETAPRLITIAGGKLTCYRATAERVVGNISSTIPGRATKANTRKLKLPAESEFAPV
jgi:glycerol-3-phosphate dehydrogenase